MPNKPLIFVSCGQYSSVESKLGIEVCNLVRELRPDVEPYFADAQSTLDGLSSNILKALYRSAGFICVMHRRGDFKLPDGMMMTRGSVWVEQEIAIAAFMNHTLGRSIPLLYYKQFGICIEGLRSVLLMNPVLEFTEEHQVLESLRALLPVTIFNPYADYDVIPLIDYKEVTIHGDRHVYSFIADVKNVGNQRVTDFEMRVFFPRNFLKTGQTMDRNRSTATHSCFVADSKSRAPNGLYPGDNMRNALTIEYSIDHELLDNPRAMQGEINIELYSGLMEPKKISLPIKKFQHF
jgi:hypothetical protein